MSVTDMDSTDGSARASSDFITVKIGEQWFGFPVAVVHDVFMPQNITYVPLARTEVAGVLNLRGRIVTAIDMRTLLDLPARDTKMRCMAVGIEKGGESYGLLIDEVGEVLSIDDVNFESNPSNLDPRWAEISKGVYRLDGMLLVVLDTDRILAFEEAANAA